MPKRLWWRAIGSELQMLRFPEQNCGFSAYRVADYWDPKLDSLIALGRINNNIYEDQII